MADISKIEINNVSYNIKDATARQMIENLPTGGTGGGGDWDQNDPLGDGYIKHRTHWKEEIGGEILLPETTVQFSGSGTTLTSATAAADALAEGDKVSVFWNGTKYVCEVFTYYGYSCLGNASLNTPSAEDTGEPFLFIFQRGGNVTINKKSSAAETITIKVGGKDTIYHKLPGEFLPDGVPYVETGITELMPETDASSFTDPTFGKAWAIHGVVPNLKVGETYTVTYNGASYECVCQAAPAGIIADPAAVAVGNFSVVGGANTGEPFAMLLSFTFSYIAIIDLVGSSAVKVKIVGIGETIHKLDPKFLADNIGGGLHTVVIDVDLDTQGDITPDISYSEIATKAKDPNAQVRALVRMSIEGMVVVYLYLNLTGYNTSNGDITFTTPYNQYSYLKLTLFPSGSATLEMVDYTYNNA